MENVEDTEEVIRIRISKNRQYNGRKKNRQCNGRKKNRQYNGRKKNRQYNGRKKRGIRKNNDLHNTTQKPKYIVGYQ